jgi:hypothetical protein
MVEHFLKSVKEFPPSVSVTKISAIKVQTAFTAIDQAEVSPVHLFENIPPPETL